MTSTALDSPSALAFLGSEIVTDFETARVAILPIPYEATTTYRQGCQHGPESILEASQQLECYDDELDREVGAEVGIYTHCPIADTRLGGVPAETMLEITQQTVIDLVQADKFVIALGGEHSITAGVVAAYQRLFDKPFTVVQIDAHGDLRHKYEGSIHNHACVMRRIVEMGLPTVQIGIRSLCKEEATLIKEEKLSVIWARDIATDPHWMGEAIANISTNDVFLTIDLDGLDPSLMPGVGTPEPGGLNWYSLLEFLQQLFTTHRVIGCDVMELAPVQDSVVSEFTTAKLVYKLIGYQALAQEWFKE
ncbi:MAG: agmatinase [Oscillatoriales cyanobacterium RM2_1_1]|nr:agmatinase [Oscillatoriales cyanobacterium RM2_1_1]